MERIPLGGCVSDSKVGVLLKFETQSSRAAGKTRGPSASESCAKIKNLGFTASKHINMYGERFEIVSDPFSEGDYVAVHATSGTDPEIRTLRLPTAILVSEEDRFLKRSGSAG